MSELSPMPSKIETRTIKEHECVIATFDEGRVRMLGPTVLDEGTAPEMRAMVVEAVQASDASVIEYDLSNVDVFHSIGLGVLVGALKRSTAIGKEFRVVNLNQRAKKLFEITGLVKPFGLTPPES